LVIDLATLRQVQAAATNATPGRITDVPPGPAASAPIRREINRLNVPLTKEAPTRTRLLMAAAILAIAILGSGVLAARWWRGMDGSSSAVVNANNDATSPTPSPTASPSPSPSPKPTPRSERRREQPSRLKKVWNKMKGIFK